MTLKESYQAMVEIEKSKSSKFKKAKALSESIHDTHAEEIQLIREGRVEKIERRLNYKDKVYNEMVATALKAIYITSLEEVTIMDSGNYGVANRLIDNYVNENGGQEILETMGSKNSQFLTDLKSIIEDSAEEVIKNSDDSDIETNVAPDEEPKEKMLDKMEKDDDVDVAVDLIAKRISDAEEEFIKKNAKDKEKIKNLVDNVNDRIAAVKDDNNISDNDKAEIAQEAKIECNRKIADVHDKRSHTIFEDMVEKTAANILKDEHLKSLYTTETGTLNMPKVVSSVKCMYGFLECVSTIKLEKVTPKYIETLMAEI